MDDSQGTTRQKVRDFEERTRQARRDREVQRHNRKMERLAGKGTGCAILFLCLVVPIGMGVYLA